MTLTTKSYTWHDSVTGSAEELVNAGIVTADMLPGQPGNGKVMCTYMAGQRLGKGANVPRRDASYRQIVRKGKDRYEVFVGLSPAEVAQRTAQEDAVRERDRAAAFACLLDVDAPMHWVGRIGVDFAVRVVRRQHLRVV